MVRSMKSEDRRVKCGKYEVRSTKLKLESMKLVKRDVLFVFCAIILVIAIFQKMLPRFVKANI